MRFRFAALLFFAAVASSAQTPAVSSLYPASGRPEGGEFVHITGGALINFTSPPPYLAPEVYFGDAQAYIVSANTREIIAIAPAHAVGPVEVALSSGVPLSAGTYVYEKAGADDLERIMLPVVAGGPGAFGSVWVANVTAYARTDGAVTLRMRECPNPASCHESVGLNSRAMTVLAPVPNPGSAAAFVYVPHAVSNKIDFTLRVQDVSRQSQTWGTEIPVVFATDFVDTIWLHDVPVSSGFRSALRVYCYTAMVQAVTLNFYDESGAKLVLTHFDVTRAAAVDGSDEQPLSPSSLTYASLADAFPELRGHDRVQIEVTSLPSSLADPPLPPLPIWAFVSVTNNETQQVTTVTPHRAR